MTNTSSRPLVVPPQRRRCDAAAMRLLALLLLATIAGCGEQAQPPAHGQSPPAFTLQTLEGRTARVPADYRGQTLAIRFWADWCPFCESEMRQLEPVYAKLKHHGLQIVAVNVRQQRDRVLQFSRGLGISYPILLDREGRMARAYGVSALPITFVLDDEGVLRGRILGESSPEVFEQLVLETMGSR